MDKEWIIVPVFLSGFMMWAWVDPGYRKIPWVSFTGFQCSYCVTWQTSAFSPLWLLDSRPSTQTISEASWTADDQLKVHMDLSDPGSLSHAVHLLLIAVWFLASVVCKDKILNPELDLMDPSECESVTLRLNTLRKRHMSVSLVVRKCSEGLNRVENRLRKYPSM